MDPRCAHDHRLIHSSPTLLHRLAITLLFLSTIGFIQCAHAQQWNLVWSDDFNGAAGSAPDPTKWTYDLGSNWGTGELEVGTNSRANSYLDGSGHLVIAILYNSGTGVYTSAHLKTAGLYAAGPYGKIEASIQVPAGNGLGSAFWSLGNSYVGGTPWPYVGEIDMMEQVGRLPSTSYGILHGPGYSNTGLGTSYTLPSSTFSAGYHTFGVIWTPFAVQWYVDGTVYEEVDNADMPLGSLWEVNDPIYLILSAGVGGSFAGPVNGGTSFPQYMNVDYVRVYSWSATPAAPTNLGASALSESQISLNWTASSTSGVTYNLYGSTSPTFALDQNTTLIATNITGTNYTVAGLYPATDYYYEVVAENEHGESGASNRANATTPASGVGSNGNAISIDAGGFAVGNFQSDVYYAGGAATSTYATVNTSFATSPAPQEAYISARLGASTYLIPGLTPSGNYILRLHFAETSMTGAGQRVFNVLVNGIPLLNNFDIYAAAGGQNQAVVEQLQVQSDTNGNMSIQTTPGSASQPLINALELYPGGSGGSYLAGVTTTLAIDSGGGTAGSFVADTDFTGGSTQVTSNTIDVSGATSPAPAAVYQSNRYGAFTYLISSLEAGTPYKIRLHFAELYWTQSGKRLFNVFLNGNQVLSNFDIYAAAGAQNKAIIEEFTILTPPTGTVEISLGAVADNPLISGIEIVATPGAVVPPAPATELKASAISSSQIDLTWAASGTIGATYNVYRSATSGFLPSVSTQIATGLSMLSYPDTGLNPATPYYYLVTANNSAGASVSSSEASAATSLLSAGPSGLAINCGGSAAASFVADVNTSSGATDTTATIVTTSGITSPAPEAVYQSERYGTFTYTIPGLTPNAIYTVRLHFADYYWTTAGQREFNVFVNHIQVLNNFDIIAAAGGPDQAVIETTDAYADANGEITITYMSGAVDQAKCSGLEIISGASASPLTLSISPSNPIYGQSVTITATDTDNGSPVNASTVTLLAGGQTFACVTNTSGVCSVAVPGGILSTGANAISATSSATSIAPLASTNSQITVAAASTTLATTVSAPSATYGTPVTLTATATPSTVGSPTGPVTFYSDGAAVGSAYLSSGFATITLSSLTASPHSITAVYSGDANYSGSTALTGSSLAITPAASTLALTLSSAIVPAATGVTLTAAVHSSTTGMPTGIVIFSSNGTVIGNSTILNGRASVTLSTLADGVNAITTTYAGDLNFIGSSTLSAQTLTITDFSMSVPTSMSTITSQSGSSSSVPFTLAAINGFTGTVVLSGTGLPPGATMSISPATVQMTPGSAANATITMVSAAPHARLHDKEHRNTPGELPLCYGFTVMPLILLGIRNARNAGKRVTSVRGCSLAFLITLLAGVGFLTMALSGCGGSSSVTAAPPASSYTITVTGTSGPLQRSVTLTWNIQ